MADIEKVIKGLESCIGHCGLKNCPYFNESCEMFGCNGNEVMKDALELLKEQRQSTKPIAVKAKLDYGSWHYECEKCNGYIDIQDKFCRHCGRLIDHY